METMKAVILKKTGGIENLEYTDVPKPKPKRGEILIKVKACALNHLDLWILTGAVAPQISMPHILGCDIAGEIAEIGKGVRGLPLGKRVVIAPGIRGGKSPHYKLGVWDSLSPEYQIVGLQNNGGYAEYAVVPAENVIPVSNKLTHEEWASIPLVFLTAWHMLITHAQLQKGETVLIQAAGSGIGSAAIQIAKFRGARIITTVGNDSKINFAKKLGADHVINYKKNDFSSEVKNITNNQGVDVAFEHIGPETMQKSILCLKKRGRLVHCGVTSGTSTQIDLRYLYMNQITLQGSFMGGQKELLEVLRLVEKGKLRPVVDKVFALSQTADALQRMIDRKNFGKIILKP
ncbi:MAG TPA: zinc-binding dehydrogenase [Candidatus Omnitrophota bacterium]|nr:zinc-binding dehydrogenase [Candidatus Omnitrophota bacterium]